MNALLAVGIAVVLLVVAGATVLTYHALWKAWQSIPPEQRRRHLAWQIGLFSLSAAILAILIAAPWGATHTVLFVFGTLCLVAIACGLIGAAGAAIRGTRNRRHER